MAAQLWGDVMKLYDIVVHDGRKYIIVGIDEHTAFTVSLSYNDFGKAYNFRRKDVEVSDIERKYADIIYHINNFTCYNCDTCPFRVKTVGIYRCILSALSNQDGYPSVVLDVIRRDKEWLPHSIERSPQLQPIIKKYIYGPQMG